MGASSHFPHLLSGRCGLLKVLSTKESANVSVDPRAMASLPRPMAAPTSSCTFLSESGLVWVVWRCGRCCLGPNEAGGGCETLPVTCV